MRRRRASERNGVGSREHEDKRNRARGQQGRTDNGQSRSNEQMFEEVMRSSAEVWPARDGM